MLKWLMAVALFGLSGDDVVVVELRWDEDRS